MAYIGASPAVGDYKRLDDISSQFNGVLTEFNLRNSGSTVTIGTDSQLLISLNGVIQEPGVAFTIGSSNDKILFTTAPDTGTPFFGIIYGSVYDTVEPADSSVSEVKIGTGAVTTSKLANSAVTESKIGTAAVTESKIGTAAVTNTKLADNSVTLQKIQDNSVTTAKIANGAINTAKLDTTVYNTIFGAVPATTLRGKILYGLKMSNDAGDTTNDINILAGSCVSDDGTTIMTISNIIKQLDAAWTVGSNQGARDTGSIADNTWHVFVIHRTDTNISDVLFSLSATAPTMPANYTKKKRIGSIVRFSGGILQFVQTGNKFRYKALQNTVSAQTQNNTARDTRTLRVPTGIIVEAEVGLIFTCPASSDYGILVTDLVNEADTAVSLTNATMNVGGNGSYPQGMTVLCSTNTSGQIGIRAATAGGTVNVSTRGWTDWEI